MQSWPLLHSPAPSGNSSTVAMDNRIAATVDMVAYLPQVHHTLQDVLAGLLAQAHLTLQGVLMDLLAQVHHTLQDVQADLLAQAHLTLQGVLKDLLVLAALQVLVVLVEFHRHNLLTVPIVHLDQVAQAVLIFMQPRICDFWQGKIG